MSKSENFVSELSAAPERWLSRVMAQALSEGFRSPEDFLEYFSPNEIMESLDDDPDLRAKLLVHAAGVHERIARKKSTNSAAEDLRIALDEGICDASLVLELFPADERVTHLDNGRLWSFLTEDEWWTNTADSERSIQRLTFMLDTALDEELLTLQDFADAVTFEEIAKRLPREDLEALLVSALNQGRKQNVFDEAALFDSVPLSTLVEHLSPETVWNTVVLDKIVTPSGLLSVDQSERASEPRSDASARAAGAGSVGKTKSRRRRKTVVGPASALKTPAAAAPSATPRPPTAPPVVPAATVPAAAVAAAEPEEPVEAEAGEALSARTPQEEEARKRVTNKLRAIDRLPPKYDTLPTGILLSMESMYAELFQLSSDEEREECIRDSFPNESLLTQAMLALIELLDPSIDITDPVIRDADVASLIKVVLFEERHRAEQANPSRSSAPVPPPPGQSRRPPAPPPLPQGKSSPPPLPPRAR